MAAIDVTKTGRVSIDDLIDKRLIAGTAELSFSDSSLSSNFTRDGMLSHLVDDRLPNGWTAREMENIGSCFRLAAHLESPSSAASLIILGNALVFAFNRSAPDGR